MSSHSNLKHAATEPAHIAARGECAASARRGAAGRAAALRRAPSDSDCSAETGSLSADSGDKPPSTVRAAPPPVARGNTKRSRRRGSEWEVLEGLKDGQRFEKRPEVFNGYLHKKRKWPLKGWHKRYFVVDGGILVYARGPSDVARGRLHGSVDVGLSVISAKQRRRRIDIDADEFIYHLRAKTPDLFRAWLNVLKTHRLYRQHLLTFGVRETAPRINAPSDDFPTAESVSRLTISNSSDICLFTVSRSQVDISSSRIFSITLSENKIKSRDDVIRNILCFDSMQTSLCESNAKVSNLKLINSDPTLYENNLRNTTSQRFCIGSCSLESTNKQISKSIGFHTQGPDWSKKCKTSQHITWLNKGADISHPTCPKIEDNISASKSKFVCAQFKSNRKILMDITSPRLVIKEDNSIRASRKCTDLPTYRYGIEPQLDGHESNCFLMTYYIQKPETETSTINKCEKKLKRRTKAKEKGKASRENVSKYNELKQTIKNIMNNLNTDSRERTQLISSIEIIASDVKKIAARLESVVSERNKMSEVCAVKFKNELTYSNLSRELSNRSATAERKRLNTLFNKLSSENAYKTADEDLVTNKYIDIKSTNGFFNGRIPFKLNTFENTAIVENITGEILKSDSLNNENEVIITNHQAIMRGEVKRNKSVNANKELTSKLNDSKECEEFLRSFIYLPGKSSKTHNTSRTLKWRQFEDKYDLDYKESRALEVIKSPEISFPLPDVNFLPSHSIASDSREKESLRLRPSPNLISNKSNPNLDNSNYKRFDSKYVLMQLENLTKLAEDALSLHKYAVNLLEKIGTTKKKFFQDIFERHSSSQGQDSKIEFSKNVPTSEINATLIKSISAIPTYGIQGKSHNKILNICQARSVMVILGHENQYSSDSDLNYRTDTLSHLKTVPSTIDQYTSIEDIKGTLNSKQIDEIPNELNEPLDPYNDFFHNVYNKYSTKTTNEIKDDIISNIMGMLPPIPSFPFHFQPRKNLKIERIFHVHAHGIYFSSTKTGSWLEKSLSIEDGTQSEPNLSSGLGSPTSGVVRGPQAGFVSGTPGGRLGSWVIGAEAGGSLESVSRELGQAQLSVQQLQRLLETLELQQQAHHDTDVSLDGASPNVKKDRRKFGLRKKKSQSSKCGSVDLQLPHHQLDGSVSHSALSALTAPPSPGGGSSSVPGSAASLPIACAAARPQSLPGTESLGAAMTGPASLTSLTPDHQIREDFTVLAKDLVSSLKSIVGTLCAERARAADAEAPAGASGGAPALATLRNNLSAALHQNSELKSRLARIHDASDLAELSLGPVTDLLVSRQFAASLSYSSSCVSASEFFDAEEHDDDELKEPTLLAGAVEGGVIELEGDTSSEAGSLSSEEGSASSDNSDAALLNAESNAMTINEVGGESSGAGWVRRTRLPSPRPTPGGPSLWNLLYKNIGKDLSQVSMPVSINEPLNMLQRLCEELEYSELLDTASECKSDMERMSLMAAFAVSAYASAAHRAASKPFNPLLGETYECVREDRGFRFIAEQVSHHPPVSVCHAESPRWTFWQEARIKTKFWGKSMEFQPAGRVHVLFHATGDHYSWNKVTTCVHNLFGGQRWVDQYGDMHICSDTNLTCKLNFIKASSWSATRHEVRGAVTGGSAARPLRLAGRWSEALYAGDPPAARCLWRPGAMPPEHELYYGFTRFAMELNEMEPGMRGTLPHTDTRLRPDQRALEEGDVDAAERFKSQLEQAQRERRRDFPDHTARWFRKTAGASGDGEEWVYGGDYWRAREAGFPGEPAPRIW